MRKQKKYNVADTNMANFGSDLEKNIKRAAANTEQAWKGAGTRPGIEVGGTGGPTTRREREKRRKKREKKEGKKRRNMTRLDLSCSAGVAHRKVQGGGVEGRGLLL